MTLGRFPLNSNPQGNIADQIAYRHLQAIGMGTFSAHKNSNQEGLDNGPNQITFDDAEYNPSNWYSTTTSRFTPKLKGYYRINCQLFVDAGVANKHATLLLYKDGNRYKVLGHVQMSNTDDVLISGTGIVKSNGGNYWEIFLEHDSDPSTLDIIVPGETEESNFFEGELISIQGAGA
jgi:hypothetical protein